MLQKVVTPFKLEVFIGIFSCQCQPKDLLWLTDNDAEPSSSENVDVESPPAPVTDAGVQGTALQLMAAAGGVATPPSARRMSTAVLLQRHWKIAASPALICIFPHYKYRYHRIYRSLAMSSLDGTTSFVNGRVSSSFWISIDWYFRFSIFPWWCSWFIAILTISDEDNSSLTWFWPPRLSQ